jgi:hypothetical protein
LTPAANVSEHVVRELELAQSCKCRVVPVLVGATRPIRRIGFLIAPVQWISVGDEDPGVVERAIRSVLFSASSSG